MLDGLSDSESVREMSMSESDQEVREVKVTVDSDSEQGIFVCGNIRGRYVNIDDAEYGCVCVG